MQCGKCVLGCCGGLLSLREVLGGDTWTRLKASVSTTSAPRYDPTLLTLNPVTKTQNLVTETMQGRLGLGVDPIRPCWRELSFWRVAQP